MAAEFAVSRDIEERKSRNLSVSKTSVEMETFYKDKLDEAT